MNTSIQIMWILVTLTTLLNSQRISPKCDMNRCKGYYKLLPHVIKKPNVEVTNTQLKITEIDPVIEVTYIKRRWLTIYCYDGTAIDFNTGCDEAITLQNPTCDNLRKWTKYHMCPTGWECRPDGGCRGNDANKKCFDSSTITSNVGPQTLKWEGTRDMVFPVHTCVSSWECNRFVAKLDTFAKISAEKELEWVFYDKDNREHQINSNTYEVGHTNDYGEKLCLNKPINGSRMTIENAVCYSENPDNIKCMVKSNSEKNGLVFDIARSGEGTLRNMKVEVVGQLMVPENGKIVDLNADKTNKYNYPPNTLLDRQRSVNVETAHELAIGANILQMQSLYNIMSLAQEVDEIYNVLINIVKSQSIDDPNLISKILKKPNFAVKWSNEEVFEQCGCLSSPSIENSNCQEGKLFSYGSYVELNDTSQCYYIPLDAIQNVSLVNASAIRSEFIKYLPPQTASSDSASWDMLNDYRNKMIEGDRTSHSYESLQDKIAQLEDRVGLGSLHKVFLYSSCAAAWVSIAILFFRRKV